MSDKPLPCPHGRNPIGNQDGWKHCPHCLGLNNTAKPGFLTGVISPAPNNMESKCCPKCNFKGVAQDTPNITYFGEEYCGKPDCPCHAPKDNYVDSLTPEEREAQEKIQKTVVITTAEDLTITTDPIYRTTVAPKEKKSDLIKVFEEAVEKWKKDIEEKDKEEEWEKNFLNLLYDYGNVCVEATNTNDFKAMAEEGRIVKKLLEVIKQNFIPKERVEKAVTELETDIDPTSSEGDAGYIQGLRDIKSSLLSEDK